MKKVLLFLSLIIVISSCNHYSDNYVLSNVVYIPDSLKDKQAQFITETVRAASQHMSGGDYEDPEDVIYAANSTFENIYGIKVECLYNTVSGIYIHKEDFDSIQTEIFYHLKYNK